MYHKEIIWNKYMFISHMKKCNEMYTHRNHIMFAVFATSPKRAAPCSPKLRLPASSGSAWDSSVVFRSCHVKNMVVLPAKSGTLSWLHHQKWWFHQQEWRFFPQHKLGFHGNHTDLSLKRLRLCVKTTKDFTDVTNNELVEGKHDGKHMEKPPRTNGI